MGAKRASTREEGAAVVRDGEMRPGKGLRGGQGYRRTFIESGFEANAGLWATSGSVDEEVSAKIWDCGIERR